MPRSHPTPTLAEKIALQREAKAARCDELAEAHATGRHFVTYQREARFWRDAAQLAREGDTRPLSFETARS